MKKNGFTLIELIVAIAIMGIAAAIAIPGFSRWLPNYRLRSAARDVYSNMQLAKMGAVRANMTWRIVFDTGAGSYSLWSPGPNGDWDGGTGDDEQVRPTVDLSSYESGVAYGHGNATDDIPGNGAPPADDITYASDVAVFNSRGTGSGGYVYLENNKNTTTYAIGTRTSGVILLRKWNSSIADWE
ncbi:MAG: GspH/FimT family pseudopilin [Deltaproteobacteria bacterium]|nr:GspH/FimT family pseudopilin [Deltaproteobacteria bacterium]